MQKKSKQKNLKFLKLISPLLDPMTDGRLADPKLKDDPYVRLGIRNLDVDKGELNPELG